MTDNPFPHAYGAVRDALRERLAAPPAHRVQLLTGPRQVGKTTLLLELERTWPGTAVYAAADAPGAALSGWWEAQWARAEQASRERPALLLLDEVHYLPDWSRRLKASLDDLRRRQVPVHVVATGSSALSVGRGSRETMAGRFERLHLLHWQAAELAARCGKAPEAAARDLVAYGGYPGAVPLEGQPDRWRAYVREAIVEPAIGRDLLAIAPVRRPGLLRQVFAVAIGHPAEVLSLQKIGGQLQDPGALETIAHYLHLLEEACLVAAVPKHSGQVVRRRASPPKLVPLSNALVTSALDEAPAVLADQPERRGRLVENACIAAAWNAGQAVHYWRAEPLEVDLVTTGSWGRWAVEVKTGPVGAAAARGVLEFCRRNPSFRPAIACDPAQVGAVRGLGVAAVAWPELLLRGLVRGMG